MDLGSAIFGIFALACFIVPVIYLQRAKKKERTKFLKGFTDLAEQQQLSISEHDFWNHCFAIGIDTSKNKLFYLKKQKETEQKFLIDLSEVEYCRVNNINRSVNQDKIIERLELVFTFRNSKLPQKALEFYNKDETMALHDELQLIEKWKTNINSRLEVKRKLPLAS